MRLASLDGLGGAGLSARFSTKSLRSKISFDGFSFSSLSHLVQHVLDKLLNGAIEEFAPLTQGTRHIMIVFL
jgi:hypothetical protein